MQILAFVGFTALVAVISYWFSRSQMVYELYGLSEEEIAIVEST